MKEMIVTLYEYDCWANRRIFDGAQQLSEEQYRAPSAFGSLHHALSHLAGVEILWRTLAQDGTLSQLPPSEQELASLDEVHALWQEEEKRCRAFLEGLTEADLAAELELTSPRGDTNSYARWEMLNHMLLHSMQHRTEAAAILTEHDRSPGNLDFIFFIRERK